MCVLAKQSTWGWEQWWDLWVSQASWSPDSKWSELKFIVSTPYSLTLSLVWLESREYLEDELKGAEAMWKGAECPQRTPSPSKGWIFCLGEDGRCTQCPGSYINSQLPTHSATHGTKECGWLGSCMGHPSPQSYNYPSSLCLSAPGAGGCVCPGLMLVTRPMLGSVAGPCLASATPTPNSPWMSLHQPLTLWSLTYYIIADNHNKPKGYYNLIHSRHWVKCHSCIFSCTHLNNPTKGNIVIPTIQMRKLSPRKLRG